MRSILERNLIVAMIGITYVSVSYAQICPGDPRCLNNPYGAGNPNKPDGLMNPYSQYGSRHSNQSHTNPYATNAPKIYDAQGNYRGRLSSNPYDLDSVSNPYGRYGNPNSPESPKNIANRYNPNPYQVVPQNSGINIPGSSQRSASGYTAAPYVTPAAAAGVLVAVVGVAVVGFLLKKIFDGISSAVASSTKNVKTQVAVQDAPAPQPTAAEIRNQAFQIVMSKEVPRDYDKARDLFLRAADMGDREAIFGVGLMHYNGVGFPKSEANSMEWFTRAADAGLMEAQAIAGDYYGSGRAGKEDFERALKYYKMAAEQNHPDSMAVVGLYYYHGMGVALDKSEALKWMRKSAELNSPWGHYYLAGALMDIGDFSKENIDQAVKSNRIAAEHGHIEAMHHLALMLRHKPFGHYDPKQAAVWYRRAAEAGEQGFPGAQNNLGDMYENGDGVVKSPSDAVYWYTRAAMFGEPTAYLSLGTCFAKGVGLQADPAEAYFWLLLAMNKLPEGNNKSEAGEWLDKVKQQLTKTQVEYAELRAKTFKPLKQTDKPLGDRL